MTVCVADLEADGYLEEATKVWCGVFKDVNTGKTWEFGPDQVPDMLRFMDTIDVLVIHNGTGYDHPLLQKLYGYVYKGVRVDTLLVSRLQRPDRTLPFACPNKKVGPHSIEAWGYRVGRGKPSHSDWSRYSPEMLHRCREDTEILALVYKTLREEGGPEWRRAHELTHSLFEILYEQERYGWLVDQEWMHHCIHQLNYWMDKIDKIVVPKLPSVLVIEENKKNGEYLWVKKPFLLSGKNSKATGERLVAMGLPPDTRDIIAGPFSRVNFRPVNLNSNAEVKRWLLESGWIPEKWNYKKDKSKKLVRDDQGNLIRTSPVLNGDDPFIGVDGGVGRLIARRVRCRHRRSNIEGWLKIIRPDGRISQRITGICTTGRLKHSGIVNVPGADAFFGKWMRKCFISKPGYKIVGVDAAGCQNRMLAARVGNDAFTEILVNGDKELGTAIHQVNQKAIAEWGINVNYKQAKNLNYAFMFGASDSKLGAIIGGGKDHGSHIRKALLGIAPGFEELIETLTEEWRATAKHKTNRWGGRDYFNGSITGLDGRPVLIESEHQILVYSLQSDEAILMQHSLVLLKKRLDRKGWIHGREYGFVANVHDEYQAEVRDDLCEEYAKEGEAAITDAAVMLGIACPHEGSAEIGNNWWETH